MYSLCLPKSQGTIPSLFSPVKSPSVCRTRIPPADERFMICRKPVPRIFLPVALAVLALTLFAYTQMPKSLADYRIYATAEKRIEQGMLYDTLSQLEQATQRHPDSTDLSVRLVTLSMDYGRYDYAAYCMNTYLVGKSFRHGLWGYDPLPEYTEQLL